LSGFLVKHYNLPGLIFALVPGLLLLGGLVLAHRSAGHRLAPVTEHLGLSQILAGRWLAMSLILAVATLRVAPVLGVPIALAFLLAGQGCSEEEIGWSQSLFLLSGGVGTLACPLFVRPGRELAALIGTIIPAGFCLCLLVYDDPRAYYAGLTG